MEKSVNPCPYYLDGFKTCNASEQNRPECKECPAYRDPSIVRPQPKQMLKNGFDVPPDDKGSSRQAKDFPPDDKGSSQQAKEEAANFIVDVIKMVINLLLKRKG